MANNQTNEQAASDDKRRLAEFFHALVDKDKPLTEIPWNNLGKEETMEFLIERIKKGDKAEIAKVVENIGHFSYQLQEQKYRVLAAAVSKGYWGDDIPPAEYVTGSDGEERNSLLDAIVKQGRGEVFLITLGQFAVSDNVPVSTLEATYNYVADRMNGGRLSQWLNGKRIDTYDEFATDILRRVRRKQAKAEHFNYWTDQLKTKGVEALQLFNESTEAAVQAYEVANRKILEYHPVNYKNPSDFLTAYHSELNKVDPAVFIKARHCGLMRHPEFIKELKIAFEAQVEKGAEGTLKSARVAHMLYRAGVNAHDESLQELVRGAVKKYPELLNAIEKVLDPPPPYFTTSQKDYLDLASAAVTGADFNWQKDLNLKRLSHKLDVGYNDDPDWRIYVEELFKTPISWVTGREPYATKHLDFKEQMTLIVSSAKEAAKTDSRVKVPEEFEIYVSGGAREKLATKINKLQEKRGHPFFAKFITEPSSNTQQVPKIF